MWWLAIPVIIYATVIFIMWMTLVRWRGYKLAAPANLPSVSVVVAARNEENHIGKLLAGLTEQDYPPDQLEIIIVNDNSTDRTPIIVSEFIEKQKHHSAPLIRLIYNPFTGKKRALRYAIGKAGGDVILVTDADCITGRGWIRSHAALYGDCQADMVVAEVIQRPARGFVLLFGVLEFSALQSVTEAAVVAGHPVMCNGANMSFRRESYLKHAEELHEALPSGDDTFLLHAVVRGGGRVMYAAGSAAAVETAPAVTAAALLRQRARWASKAFFYTDAPTLLLAAATAACNAAVTAAAVASVISAAYIPVLGTLYAIRLVPDYLIIARNMKRRREHVPVLSFLLSEILYPYWFCMVAVRSLLPSSRRFGRR
jgi:biofilm PGA synthesis N-glycosyltransferase PgaC